MFFNTHFEGYYKNLYIVDYCKDTKEYVKRLEYYKRHCNCIADYFYISEV